MQIGLVSCSVSKRAVPSQPKDLYMESTLFSKARRHCETFHDDWYVLSAKHGLLAPDGPEIEPYDLSLDDISTSERRRWDRRVAEQLRERELLDDRLVLHAGAKYRRPLIDALGDELTYEVPTEGLQIGKKLRWYNQRYEARGEEA